MCTHKSMVRVERWEQSAGSHRFLQEQGDTFPHLDWIPLMSFMYQVELVGLIPASKSCTGDLRDCGYAGSQ